MNEMAPQPAAQARLGGWEVVGCLAPAAGSRRHPAAAAAATQRQLARALHSPRSPHRSLGGPICRSARTSPSS